MEQLKRWADYVHILSACLPPFLPADFKEQAGRTHTRKVEDTEFSSLKISLEISERDERRGLTSIQNLWKSHKPSSSQKHTKLTVGGENWSALTFSD
jgi:hypothetical protein